jgi:PIN domain nuclease of toxin-antitoxin system
LIPLLLDTCALIFLAEEVSIAKTARDAVAEAAANEQPIYVSQISGWEIGLLVSNGRLRLPLPPEAWFERVLAAPNVHLSDLPLQVLIASSFLPGNPPKESCRSHYRRYGEGKRLSNHDAPQSTPRLCQKRVRESGRLLNAKFAQGLHLPTATA